MRKKLSLIILFLLATGLTVSGQTEVFTKVDTTNFERIIDPVPQQFAKSNITISLQPMPLFFGVKLSIMNKGDSPVEHINWTFNSEGGIFLRGGTGCGTITGLPPGENLEVKLRPFLGRSKSPRGVGRIEMEAIAQATITDRARTTAEAFQLFWFTIFQTDEGDTTKYQVTFDAVWSEQTHPDDFPSNPHFSGLIGATHNENVTFWDVGELASPGIKNMAETGAKQPLDSEIQAAIDDGTAFKLLSGEGINPSPGSVSLVFKVRERHPLVTLVSMIAPSPDWFIGIDSLNLFENGTFVDEKTVVLYAFDAGTDSGTTYTSPDLPTDPPEPIFLIEGYPFFYGGELIPLGTYTFTKI
jgi:hypothetical protein